MRKKYIFSKKLYISILTTILILLTTVATTFAWIGVFANSTFESFNIGVRVSNLDEYNIEISLDGINFPEDGIIKGIDIKKQILRNWGYSDAIIQDDEKVNLIFAKLDQDQCTTIPNVTKGKMTSLGQFVDVYGDPTNKYFKFDIYISVKKVIDQNSLNSDFLLDAYLDPDLMSGRTQKLKTLFNPVVYEDSFVNPYSNMIMNGSFNLPANCRLVSGGEKITEAKVDASTASRMAFEKFKVVEKGHPELYDSEEPISAVIYQNGYEYPVYNTETQTYNFGAILPNEYNFATINYNLSEWQFAQQGHWVMDLPDEIYQTRGVESSTKDLVISRDNNHIIDSSNSSEQISIGKMMKITVSFWFEGWDADCFNSINASIVDLNICFNQKNEDE